MEDGNQVDPSAFSPIGGDSESDATPRSKRPWRWWLAASVAVILLAVAGGQLIGSSTNAEAVVTSAAAASSLQNTGLIALDGSIQAAGKSIHISGTGQFDLDQTALMMDATYSGPSVPSGLGMSEIITGGTLYEGGAMFAGQLVDGKSWIGIPYAEYAASSSAQAGSTGSLGSMAGMIAALRQRGSAVTDIGSGSVGGVNVERYEVVPSVDVMKQKLEQSTLPSAIKQQALAMFTGGTIKFTVAIDGAKMLRQISFDWTLNVAGRAISTHMVETISKWGEPVFIGPPPLAQVCSATISTVSSCTLTPPSSSATA